MVLSPKLLQRYTPKRPRSTFPKRVWIAYGEEDQDMGFWQYCAYEKIPDLCTFCKKIGHSKFECKVFDKMYEKEKCSKQGNMRVSKSLKPINQEGKQQPCHNTYSSNNEKGKEKQGIKENDMSWKKVWKRKKGNEGHSSGLSIQEKEQVFKAKHSDISKITSYNRFDVLNRQEEVSASLTQVLPIINFSESHSKQTVGSKLTPKVTIHNSFEVLNQQLEGQANNQDTMAHIEKQNSSILAIKETDSEEDFLAEQRAFLTAQELAKVAGATYAEVIQSVSPISICIKNPLP